jgi:predicted small metal-binding protein
MIEVTCMCGFQARGTEDEVIDAIQAHGSSEHGAMSSREQILAMATPVPSDVGDAG